jgi:hypothetical protein
MSEPTTYGVFRPNGSSPNHGNGGDVPLSELTLSFVPLSLVTEWTRCSETADYVARFFSHDFTDREVAGNVLSTVVNELVENVAKFSSDKARNAKLTVREYDDRLTIATSNVISVEQVKAFGETVRRLTDGDPESMFAEQIAHPPETGSAGIGLIMLRKDYGATIGARMTGIDAGQAAIVDVEVTIENREVGEP